MSNKQKSKIALRDSVEIKVTLNGRCVHSVPKMNHYGSWPDAKLSGRVRKASGNSSSGHFKRPRGRDRLGMIWNSKIGTWVKDRNKKPVPPTEILPFKEKMEYLTLSDSESNKRSRIRRSEYTFEQDLAQALHKSRTPVLKKVDEEHEKLNTSNKKMLQVI